MLLSGPGSVDAFALAEGKLLFVGMRGLRLQELYALEAGQARQLTRFNEEIFAQKSLSALIPLSCESDGVQIHGFVIPPVDFDPAKSYPCILDIHGGPKTAYGSVFFHEMQLCGRTRAISWCCATRAGATGAATPLPTSAANTAPSITTI